MLKQRVMTALCLLAVLLPALFWASPEPFFFVALILVSAGAWEWARLNGSEGVHSLLWALLALAECVAAWWLAWPWQPVFLTWALVGGLWVVVGACLLRYGPIGWSAVPVTIRLVAGNIMLCAAWLAIAQAKVVGVNFLLSALVLVWVADVCAYFFGRAFGGRWVSGKLAPSISPGKSWEGVWGGMFCVIVLAFGWVAADASVQASVPSLYTVVRQGGVWLVVVVPIFMSAMSVVGDLTESLVKRSAGAKDSSALLPGHGGVLDRLDALLPTLPFAMFFYSFPWH